MPTFDGLKTENPLLYMYEIRDNGISVYSEIISGLGSKTEEEISELIDLPGSRYTYCSILDKECFEDSVISTLLKARPIRMLVLPCGLLQ